MVEFHGWATVRANTVDPLAADELEALERMLPNARMGAGTLGWKVINGEAFLWCAGMPNHRGSEFDEVLGFFGKLAGRFPGSYGLLFFRDDEDGSLNNCFRVLRLARGELSESTDALLSPCVPTVEDE